MKVLVTGKGGMLSLDLIPFLEKKYEVTALSEGELDITDTTGVEKTLQKIKPGIIINCAAYTNVDGAEGEEEKAFSVNARAVENLARESKKINSRLLHISTDFVFDGKTPLPYKEEDETNPISVYGRSKLKGELAIRRSMEDFIIIRTSWLYGQGENNFPKKIISRAKEKDSIGVVYDQIGTPTSTVDLSEAITALMDAPSGIYNFSNEGVASWYDLAYALIEEVKKRDVPLKLKRLTPILTKDFPTPAPRPNYSVLDKTRYKNTTGKTIPHWRDALRRYVERQWQ